MVLAIKFKENKEFSLKENFIFIIKSLFTWGIAYLLMWISKWILASIILGKSAIPYVFGKAKRRINGPLYNKSDDDMYKGVILRNILIMYPINIVKQVKKLILPAIVYFISQVLIIDYKNIKKTPIFFCK